MAKATKRTTRSAASRASKTADPREAIVDAFMALAAERKLRDIGLADIAEKAGVSLAELRAHYAGIPGILADFAKRIDSAVLADGPADADSEPRDRLFEIMMRRFDALAPYKPAIRRIAAAALCDPGFAAVLHCLALRSQKWTLTAAGLEPRGLRGRVAVEGIVLVHGEAMRAWLKDDSEDLGRTMAALDKGLSRGERWMRMLCQAGRLLPRLARRGRRGGESPADATI